MARRKDHSRQELHKLILDAAWGIVGKEGERALTARAIAAKIGYTPGTIYNVFSSMEDLYLAVNAQTLERMSETLSQAQDLKEMARHYYSFSKKYYPYWLMIFTHTPAEKVPQWYEDKIADIFLPLEKLLQPLLPGAARERVKRSARILWASVHGLFFLEATGKISRVSKTGAIEMADELISIFLNGLQRSD